MLSDLDKAAELCSIALEDAWPQTHSLDGSALYMTACSTSTKVTKVMQRTAQGTLGLLNT